jgi:hypothetical protein
MICISRSLSCENYYNRLSAASPSTNATSAGLVRLAPVLHHPLLLDLTFLSFLWLSSPLTFPCGAQLHIPFGHLFVFHTHYDQTIYGAGTAQSVQRRAGFPVGTRVSFSTPQRPDRLCWPLLFNEYRGLFLRGWSGQGAKLTTDLHLVPRSRMVELYLHSPYVFMAWCWIKYRGKFTFFL